MKSDLASQQQQIRQLQADGTAKDWRITNIQGQLEATRWQARVVEVAKQLTKLSNHVGWKTFSGKIEEMKKAIDESEKVKH